MPGALAQRTLTDIARGVACAEDWWRPHAHHDPSERRPVRLLATDSYEVWVIGWTAGQGVELHDHGDSAGAIVVVEGELAELELDVAAGTLRRRPLRPGGVHHVPVGHVHDVVAPRNLPTTSIHVYSPPLTTMRRWDPVTLEPGDQEVVASQPASFPSVGGTHPLHPSSARLTG